MKVCLAYGPRAVVTRKVHICWHCTEEIPAGERCLAMDVTSWRETKYVHVHVRCVPLIDWKGL